MSDSYIGFDYEVDVEFTLKEDPTDNKVFEYSKEDKAAIEG